MSGVPSRQKLHVGCLHLTVEASPVVGMCHLAQHRCVSEVTKQLVQLLDAHRVPATIATNEPGRGPLTSLVTLSKVRHELALLGDSDWIGQGAGRTRFAGELVRRVGQARAAGVEIVTLVPRTAIVGDHLDLVAKQRIGAVVGTAPVLGRKYRPTRPQTLHYGVWEFAATERLPRPTTWFSDGGWKLIRGIRNAAREAGTFHLVIDASSDEEQAAPMLTMLTRLVRRVARLRDRGLLRVETLGEATARLADRPAATPQRSILRVA
jgi:hypothetical protein